ncbi:MAG: class I SAM-dependent methyltransferase [Gammaproteobacteria bacterium]|nr:class I SAM-dependent methyltransferase [Gammaproteobacteria bacterium]
MKPIVNEAIEQYAFEHTRAEPENLATLTQVTRDTMESPQMLTGRLEGRFLKLLVQIVNPQLIVEVGMFTGYSALSMAEGLEPGGRIITCEVNPEAQKVAQTAFESSPFGNRIEIRMGPAIDTIRSIDEVIDLSFIDADKTGYPDYYEEILQRTRPGGVIVFDNMLWSGEVLDPRDDDSTALNALNKRLATDERVENVLLTIRDGVQLVRKN